MRTRYRRQGVAPFHTKCEDGEGGADREVAARPAVRELESVTVEYPSLEKKSRLWTASGNAPELVEFVKYRRLLGHDGRGARGFYGTRYSDVETSNADTNALADTPWLTANPAAARIAGSV